MKHITTEDELQELLEEHENILLDFWADWCGPCKRLAKHFPDFEEKYPITIVKVDVDEADEDLIMKYKFKTIPHIRVFKNKEEIYQGDSDHVKLEEALKTLVVEQLEN